MFAALHKGTTQTLKGFCALVPLQKKFSHKVQYEKIPGYLPGGFNPKFEISEYKVKAVQEAIKLGLISQEEPHALIYDYSRLEEISKDLISSFPKHFLHAMAVKSNNVGVLMKKIHQLGMSFESASIGEFQQSYLCTTKPSDLVFDSPTKTLAELKQALKANAYLNIDNFQELARVKELLENSHDYPEKQTIGIRINPQAGWFYCIFYNQKGYGKMSQYSTGGKISKFGVALVDYFEELEKAYLEIPWLNGVHVHVGSQTIPLDLMYSGIKTVVEFAREINKKLGKQKIQWIDIGGGLPVNFETEDDDNEKVPSFKKYWEKLSTIPELSSGEYRVITEFGRRVFSKCGFIASRIEYVKTSGGLDIALQHVGADLLIRQIYLPDEWPLRITVLDKEGNIKPNKDLVTQSIAGPCCIAADIICHKRALPRIEQGDYIIIHDTGAYSYSSFSYYNSRLPPQIIKFDRNNNDSNPNVVNMELIKKRPTIEELCSKLA